ncbi:hypothetical protein SAM19_05323 [Brevibacillus laterosporus]|nr:hypothetical protein [Brevibacillus laterosporus]
MYLVCRLLLEKKKHLAFFCILCSEHKIRAAQLHFLSKVRAPVFFAWIAHLR